MDNTYYGGDECLRRMQMIATNDEIIGFLKCNVYKYVFRCDRKHAIVEKAKEDLAKAAEYAGELCTRSDGFTYDGVCQRLLECEQDCETWIDVEKARRDILVEMERYWRW